MTAEPVPLDRIRVVDAPGEAGDRDSAALVVQAGDDPAQRLERAEHRAAVAAGVKVPGRGPRTSRSRHSAAR
ncbi:MAG: hypothetical protein ACRDZ4_19380 [Egibacteraceae bacterium]